MSCDQCGATDATAYFPGSGCTKCESQRPELGETSDYCKERMHAHCHGEFDYDCGCGCHPYFQDTGFLELRKCMTEEYFFMMMEKNYFSWILLARVVPLDKIH